MSTLPFTIRGAPVIVYVLVWIDGVDGPHLLARPGIERDEPAVERADVDAPFHTATPRLTTSQHAFGPRVAGDLRIVVPEQLAGRGVERPHLAPGAGRVHHAVDDERRRFLPAHRVEIERPREPERAHVARVI